TVAAVEVELFIAQALWQRRTVHLVLIQPVRERVVMAEARGSLPWVRVAVAESGLGGGWGAGVGGQWSTARWGGEAPRVVQGELEVETAGLHCKAARAVLAVYPAEALWNAGAAEFC